MMASIRTHPLRLTRRALSACQRWLEARTVAERLRIAGWCELSDAETEALDTFAANVRAALAERPWFNDRTDELRPEIAARLTDGIALEERDFTEFVRLIPAPMPVLMLQIIHRQQLEAGLRRVLQPRWVQLQAALDRDEAARRQARERADAAREMALQREQAARQQAALEAWAERRERERVERQTAAAAAHTEELMPTETPQNGHHPPHGGHTMVSRVHDALKRRGINPADNVSSADKSAIALEVGTTSGNVSFCLAQIRKLRPFRADTIRAPEAAAPAPEEGAETPVAAAAEPIPDAPAPSFPDPSHWEREAELREAQERAEAIGRDLAEHREALARVAAERMRLRDEVGALRAELSRLEAELASLREAVPAANLGETSPTAIEVAPLRPTVIEPADVLRCRRMVAGRPSLTTEDRLRALGIAAGGEDLDPEVWAEILRRAADAVEVVLA